MLLVSWCLLKLSQIGWTWQWFKWPPQSQDLCGETDSLPYEICRSCVTPPSLRNVSSSLLKLGQEEFRHFWRQKHWRGGPNKVADECISCCYCSSHPINSPLLWYCSVLAFLAVNFVLFPSITPLFHWLCNTCLWIHKCILLLLFFCLSYKFVTF